ncbi:uncharacterized protein LOC128919951 [Zeugodacus cucurbitae]|uniref:uncharacterized protein LOC128919951 n=1 Tax=Zeugodacus cucurbitae TaxID=28588 RepID=UPI0023D96A0F|nr:uncharacterized protein LOC128919951 [Zeugodacus cucurbitae]
MMNTFWLLGKKGLISHCLHRHQLVNHTVSMSLLSATRSHSKHKRINQATAPSNPKSIFIAGRRIGRGESGDYTTKQCDHLLVELAKLILIRLHLYKYNQSKCHIMSGFPREDSKRQSAIT